jgi:penicillin-binding protein 2
VKDTALRNLETKFKFLAGIVVFIFAILLIRLWALQIMEGATIMVKSKQNQTRVIRIEAPRGIFYDRKGNILVTSRISHNLSVVPEDIKDKPEVITLLSRILKISTAELRAKLEPNPKLSRTPYQYIPVSKDVDPTTVIKLLEEKFNLPGVEVEEVPVRSYPYNDLACHLFGYIREINDQELIAQKDKGYRLGDNIGKTGLERTYEDYLRGVSGGKNFEVDIHGRPLRLLANQEPIPGNNLHLTVDLKVQAAAEKALDEQMAFLQKYTKWRNAKSGAVVALDPRNGNILAMVSKPGFDPNSFVGVMPQTVADKIYRNPLHPLTNRTIQGEFAPGSTFKPITVISALMENKVTVKDRFYCSGYDPIYKKLFKCWIVDATSGPREHGQESIIDGLKNSCNIVMADLSRRVGADTLARYSRFFGLGKPTGLNLYPGEASGLVPDPEWKRKNTKEKDWHVLETMMFGIGQTYLTVTPIQLAEVYAAIANHGKMYRPRLISKITSPTGELVTRFNPQLTVDLQLSPEILSVVQQGLTEVIGDGGTASSAFVGFPLEKYPIAGKTGTAQKPPYDNSGVFACYAPANKPEIVVVIFLEQGGSGSGGAAPIARKILEAYFNLDKKPAPVAPATPVDVTKPNATGNSASTDAQPPVKKQGSTPEVSTPTAPATGNGRSTAPLVQPEPKPQPESSQSVID